MLLNRNETLASLKSQSRLCRIIFCYYSSSGCVQSRCRDTPWCVLRHSKSIISALDCGHVLRLGHTMVCPYNWMRPSLVVSKTFICRRQTLCLSLAISSFIGCFVNIFLSRPLPVFSPSAGFLLVARSFSSAVHYPAQKPSGGGRKNPLDFDSKSIRIFFYFNGSQVVIKWIMIRHPREFFFRALHPDLRQSFSLSICNV
jgi:hypothetical protein